MGFESSQSSTSAASNSSFGYRALYSASTGSSNVALGAEALYSNTTASNNTAVGYQSMYSNTTGPKNTAVGFQALRFGTTGINTAIGAESLWNTTTGTLNTGLGRDTLFDNTTGSYNVAVGQSALENNTTASYNTALGYQAGYSNTTGAGGISIGYQAGYTNATSNFNTFIGHKAGYSSTGRYNTFVGSGTITNVSDYGSGQLMTTGEKNTIIGGYNGNQGGLDIRTSNNNIVLSDGDGNPRVHVDSTGKTKAQSYAETYVALSGTSPAVNCNNGNVFALSTSGNTTFTFTNPPASGTAYGFTLKVTAGGTHTLTWPSSVDWAGGTAPDAPASGETDVLVFYTVDGGTNWYGALAIDAAA
jgi:hypothetical protein